MFLLVTLRETLINVLEVKKLLMATEQWSRTPITNHSNWTISMDMKSRQSYSIGITKLRAI